tara:strand:- start:529 stop:735 length:207 start_codon:yes stop_codon:yes gene_type:complete
MDISSNLIILMKQTSVDSERCMELLKKNDNDILACLKEINNIKSQEKVCNTSNQERYRIIRNLLDNKI